MLGDSQNKPVVWQSPFREGALEQQWRFETVADSHVKGDRKKSAQPGGEMRPAAKTPAPAPASNWPSLVLWCLGVVGLLAVAWRLRKECGPGMALSFVRRSMARPAKACGRGWSALDRTSRVFIVCAVALVLLIIVLPSVILWGFVIVALSVCAWRICHWQDLNLRAKSVTVCGTVAAALLLVFAIGGHNTKADAKPYITSIKEHDSINAAVGLVVVGVEIRDGEERREIPFLSGSAFAVGPQSGIMFTNRHVVEEFSRLSSDTTWKQRLLEEHGVIATEKMWVFIAGAKCPASILYTSPQFDFAMLKVPFAIKKTFRLRGSPPENLLDAEVRPSVFPATRVSNSPKNGSHRDRRDSGCVQTRRKCRFEKKLPVSKVAICLNKRDDMPTSV